MKLLLDSSFFLPFIAIDIEQFPRKAIQEIMTKEEIIRSELVIFELSAKGSKLINRGELSIEDLTLGLTAIQYLKKVDSIPIHYTEIQTLACELRKKHKDHIDCLMVATAVYYAEGMLTLDKELKKKAKEEWKTVIENINKKFKILLWEEYKKQEK